MFSAVNRITRPAMAVALAVTAAACVLMLSGLALMLTLILAPPLKRLWG